MTTKPIKEAAEAKDTIDWKLATVRQNCLNEAIKVLCGQGNNDDIIPLANKMFKFVIGEPIEQATTQPVKEWK